MLIAELGAEKTSTGLAPREVPVENPEFITTNLTGCFPGAGPGSERLLNLPVALPVVGLRIRFGSAEARVHACPRGAARIGYQRALAQGAPAALLEAERGLLSLRAGNLAAETRVEWDLELSTPTGWSLDEEDAVGGTVVIEALDERMADGELCFLAVAEPPPRMDLRSLVWLTLETRVALAADHTFRMTAERKRELTSKVVQDLLREEGFELPVEALRTAVECVTDELSPRPGLLSPDSQPAPAGPDARTRLRRAGLAIAAGEGPLTQLLSSALEALEALCAIPRELPRVAGLKFDGERLLGAISAGRFSARFLEDWLERMQRYSEEP